MAEAWTAQGIKEAVYLTRFGVDYAAQQTGRSESAIEQLPKAAGAPRKPLRKPRQMYADDIAHMMELRMMGFGFKAIAKCFNITAKGVESALKKAKKQGFDAYPKRSL